MNNFSCPIKLDDKIIKLRGITEMIFILLYKMIQEENFIRYCTISIIQKESLILLC